MNNLRKYEKELLEKSIRLRNEGFSSCSYEKGRKIQKEQDKAYKKYNFTKNLLKEMEK